jgi:hypothetical protein
MIIPSEKVAQRSAEVANVKAQGDAAVAAIYGVADATVLHNHESMENPRHEMNEVEDGSEEVML